MIIPVAIILSLISGGSYKYTIDHITYSAGNAGGIIILATVLMILFQQKYPKWWFDWNLALSRFSYRFISYLTLLRMNTPQQTKSNQSTLIWFIRMSKLT
ncbi:putative TRANSMEMBRANE PROTEIN [Dehalococcoides mccartyi]|uniref:Putative TRANSMEMBRANE PROTEIN n=1 Tax=Dehalococcoides mccartyi TaxID=61435 RepID=A0A328ELT1_9CHLR|nr:putative TRANSMEMBRANE PROTEIN [Dehalococcoides mccartyi]